MVSGRMPLESCARSRTPPPSKTAIGASHYCCRSRRRSQRCWEVRDGARPSVFLNEVIAQKLEGGLPSTALTCCRISSSSVTFRTKCVLEAHPNRVLHRIDALEGQVKAKASPFLTALRCRSDRRIPSPLVRTNLNREATQWIPSVAPLCEKPAHNCTMRDLHAVAHRQTFRPHNPKRQPLIFDKSLVVKPNTRCGFLRHSNLTEQVPYDLEYLESAGFLA
jgi:hypothetical protein